MIFVESNFTIGPSKKCELRIYLSVLSPPLKSNGTYFFEWTICEEYRVRKYFASENDIEFSPLNYSKYVFLNLNTVQDIKYRVFFRGFKFFLGSLLMVLLRHSQKIVFRFKICIVFKFCDQKENKGSVWKIEIL